MQSRDDQRDLYRTLVEAHGTELYRFAFRSCGDVHVAEDLVAEAFAEAWKSLHGLRDRESGRAWLFRILRRCCSRFYEERDRNSHHAPLELAESIAAPGKDPLETLALRQLLQRGLDRIETRYKEPLLMVFVEGMSCREAAEALELPLGTVLSRIHRARQALRSFLAAGGEPGRNGLPPGWRRIEGSG